MKKELKTFIKEHKLSDDDILKLISVKPTSESDAEKDVKDEEDGESEDQTDSKESENADKTDAQKDQSESSTTQTVKVADLEKLIATAVAKALEEKTPPPKEKKSAPKPKPATATPPVLNKFTIRDH